ncbi:MAG: PPOX class F420-dependent enzyme [Dehalococcoidia bacterium]|nr:PPOX class F420-dependent enzyme [Dehalococcoidia bacterium]
MESQPTPLPAGFLDLFRKRSFAYLATLMPSGTPQVTPVWVGFDGTHLLVNSARGRQKDRNMRERPQVAICVADPDNPYRYLSVRGTVVEVTEEGASDHIDQLSEHYTGRASYAGPASDTRVTYKIRPERTTTMG